MTKVYIILRHHLMIDCHDDLLWYVAISTSTNVYMLTYVVITSYIVLTSYDNFHHVNWYWCCAVVTGLTAYSQSWSLIKRASHIQTTSCQCHNMKYTSQHWVKVADFICFWEADLICFWDTDMHLRNKWNLHFRYKWNLHLRNKWNLHLRNK